MDMKIDSRKDRAGEKDSRSETVEMGRKLHTAAPLVVNLILTSL